MFVDGVQASIRETLRHWRADHPEALVEDLAQKAEVLIDLQGSGTVLEQDFGHRSRMERKQTNGTKYERYRVLNVKNSLQLEEASN